MAVVTVRGVVEIEAVIHVEEGRSRESEERQAQDALDAHLVEIAAHAMAEPLIFTQWCRGIVVRAQRHVITLDDRSAR
jgi:hypothetical protein